jgi:hypothetical protein
MAKKYVSKIVKGNVTMDIKDAEAQADILTLQGVSAITAQEVTAAWDSIFNNNSNS